MDDVSDTKIQQVGAALRDITEVRKDYGQRLSTAETDDEKQGLQAEAQAVMVETVRGHGLSVSEFNEVVEAADDDPLLRDRVLAAANAS